MAHKAHETWSGKNPVPTVALRSLLDPSGATEAKAKKMTGSSPQDDEQKQNEQTAGRMGKGEEMRVRDPVTGEEMMIRDADDEPTAGSKGGNVLFKEFPPPDWKAHNVLAISETQSAILHISSAYILLPLVFHLLPLPFLPTNIPQIVQVVLSLLPPSLYAYVIIFRLRNRVTADFDDRVWAAERVRGTSGGEEEGKSGQEQDEERIKESAEWLNALIKGVWPIINSDMFTSMVDMLEDIMQSSVSRFVHSVRVADLGQGNNPMRITSLRSLPDADIEDALQGLDGKEKDHLNGEHINLEISFAYRAAPSGSSARSKAHNAHLVIDFYLGIRGVYKFTVPVWVELKGVAGTARTRLQLIPDPPFIKNSLLTLVGLPAIDISVIPMSRHLPNIMNMPIVSTFIHNSIKAACAQYVAPKSLILDMQRLISGDDIKKETDAIGVIVVHIHRATGLKKMDTRGSSDPYVTVVYSRLGKPLFSTRIIEKDLNPVFEEFTAVTLDANAIKIGEKLCLQLWDSDRASADDMLGNCEIDIVDLIRNKNKASRRCTPLKGPDSRERPGSIEYTVGYYSKLPPNVSLATDGADPGVPEDLKDTPEFKAAHSIALNDLEAAVLVTTPDPEYPSGILSVQVHEIRELTLRSEGRDERMTGENEEGEDQDADEQEEGEHLPSSYCTIALNDELIYATRVKPISASPTFNAGTERFIADWRSTHVSVVVRDSRLREDDPILGIVFLKLSEILVNASQITRFFSLEHGVGHGRVRISVLFRPVGAKLPLQLLGFNTGTVSVQDLYVKSDSEEIEHMLSKCQVRMKTSTSTTKISRKSSEDHEDGAISWKMDGMKGLELPVRKRYSTALVISFQDHGPLPSRITDKTKAMAVLWLRDLIDNDQKKIQIAVWKTKDWSRLKHNYIPLSGDLSAWDSNKEEIQRVGTVELDIRLIPGITDAHEEVLRTADPAKKQIWDEFDRRTDAGLGKLVGQQEQDGGKVATGASENTEVDPQKVQQEEEHENEVQGTDDSGSENDRNEGGLTKRYRNWKREEHQLHRDHRGIMQRKPARTAQWLKDNIEKGGHKIKERFVTKERQPDVETEV